MSRRLAAADDLLDEVFHALADRTRRKILAHLGQGPATITELAHPFDMSLPAVSKHLRVLERAKLVTRSIDGRIHRCSLETAPLEKVEHWLEEHRVFWNEKLAALAHLAERRDG